MIKNHLSCLIMIMTGCFLVVCPCENVVCPSCIVKNVIFVRMQVRKSCKKMIDYLKEKERLV